MVADYDDDDDDGCGWLEEYLYTDDETIGVLYYRVVLEVKLLEVFQY